MQIRPPEFSVLSRGDHYLHLAEEGLDHNRLRLYRLCLYVCLVAGPLRLLDGEFPDREAMLRIIDVNLDRVLRQIDAG